MLIDFNRTQLAALGDAIDFLRGWEDDTGGNGDTARALLAELAPLHDHAPVCSTCGSDDVKADAFARWDHTRGEWGIASIMDDGHACEDCGGECSLVDRAGYVTVWTDADGNAAIAEGWAVSNDATDRAILARIDAPEDGKGPRFDSDDHATGFVYSRALQGSDLHRRAIVHVLNLREAGEAG